MLCLPPPYINPKRLEKDLQRSHIFTDLLPFELVFLYLVVDMLGLVNGTFDV